MSTLDDRSVNPRPDQNPYDLGQATVQQDEDSNDWLVLNAVGLPIYRAASKAEAEAWLETQRETRQR